VYLKNVELVGFKSFANKTVLEFGPGISAIVGPNGCGKSNISDAIRWVLGEQNPRLLRGNKMEDVIFNGTDSRPPLGMAEVSLTFTNCEDTLKDDGFHEITITRKVFRSGEGQYFINKTPCRLKDIQRLFMDTGIGTSSYSIMEQGKIDQILRSKPEDRREVFEEAAGITKYKTDRREAMRKLDQTEQNLLRVSDIIKEVKRQIISLQRQAGKAARYKKYYDELRRLDIYITGEKLKEIDEELKLLENQSASITEKIEAASAELTKLENAVEEKRVKQDAIESESSALYDRELEVGAKIERMRGAIENAAKRMEELKHFGIRDGKILEETKSDLTRCEEELSQLLQNIKSAQESVDTDKKEVDELSKRQSLQQGEINSTRKIISDLNNETMLLDERRTHLDNDRIQLEQRDRNITITKERRIAEQNELALHLKNQEKRIGEFVTILNSMREEVKDASDGLNKVVAEKTQTQDAFIKLEKEAASLKANIDNENKNLQRLEQSLTRKEGFSRGAKKILSQENPLNIEKEKILGTLAEQIKLKNGGSQKYAKAFNAVLSHWKDAVLVSDIQTAMNCVSKLAESEKEQAKIIIAKNGLKTATVSATLPEAIASKTARMIDVVEYPAEMKAAAEFLFGNVLLVEDITCFTEIEDADIILADLCGNICYSKSAIQLNAADDNPSNPILQQNMLDNSRKQIAAYQKKLDELEKERSELLNQTAKIENNLNTLRSALEEKMQKLARHEGELQFLQKQADQTEERLETIASELKNLEKETISPEEKSRILRELDEIQVRKIKIKEEIGDASKVLNQREIESGKLNEELMAATIKFNATRTKLEHLQSQHTPFAERINKLRMLISEYEQRLKNYEKELKSTQDFMERASAELPAAEDEQKGYIAKRKKLDELKEIIHKELKQLEEEIKQRRHQLEEMRSTKNDLHTACVEIRMKREHMLERVCAEFKIAPDALQLEAEPEWQDGIKPEKEQIENTINELRAKLEAMGPVNTGAIDEYKTLQERYSFLNQQQEDLNKAKQQLLDLIKKINQISTELFKNTFETINQNFQITFEKLFGGGTAKLIMSDEDDILESGVEIFARPPGKKLQSISLLSGGESTMTAMALLFAIYMVKPSPFCLLDELDAPLDDANNRRFIDILKGFLGQSQFLLITHNRQTISAAGILYGVTMESDKVSKIVSMKFKDATEVSDETEALQTTN
jgi:chromosome segregation protein